MSNKNIQQIKLTFLITNERNIAAQTLPYCFYSNISKSFFNSYGKLKLGQNFIFLSLYIFF